LWLSDLGQLTDEAIAPLRNSFQKAGMFRIVFKGHPDLPDRKIKSLLKIYKSVPTPNFFGQFLARHYSSGPAYEE
jgi:hypothetical protein